MTIVTDDNTATPALLRTGAGGAARPAPDGDAASPADSDVERALAAAVKEPSRVGDLLDELRRARLWVPLPDDGQPVTDGSAVTLPTVTYLGSEFVPAFTSAQRLQEASEQTDGKPVIVPHVVVRTADLARLLPPALGIALNPGAGASVPVYPEGVAYLASASAAAAAAASPSAADASGRITVGPLPAQPDALLGGIRDGLAAVPSARDAAAAWLCVEFAGEGLIISVTLDEPADAAAQEAVIKVVEQAVSAAPQDAGFPIDVTFPGEGKPDPIDDWISAFASPFYRRL
jgi:hypothetical protein